MTEKKTVLGKGKKKDVNIEKINQRKYQSSLF